MIIFLCTLIALLLAYLFYSQRIREQEIKELTEALTYKDFSRKYPEKSRNKKRHQAFNHIIEIFFDLAREKEAQQHYLKEMLELVDTGILAYDIDTYETLWMNDAFATMLNIPRIKSLNWLKKKNETLFHEIQEIPLRESLLFTIHARKQTIKTMANASLFQTNGKTYKLIAFHNISATMEEVESSAWKGLLNVMTHEIMNSIVPVASLSDTLKRKVQAFPENTDMQPLADREDMAFALETIHRRSEGLLRFAETYRNLSQKIVPRMQQQNLFDLISSIYSLMLPSLQQKGIGFDLKTDNPTVCSEMDRDLIEQVVINFITNATNAVGEKEQPQIHLFSGIDTAGHPYITVVDNGSGIADDIREKIFIPFFSTKKKGNGIGLSISREIINQHNGKIHLQSQPNEGSAFTILFRA